MIEILKAKIEELEEEKTQIKKSFSFNEFKEHREAYIDIACIDHTINTLKDLIIAEERELERNIPKVEKLDKGVLEKIKQLNK